MELTDDLVAVQGILISVIKTTGEFTKINYIGGNEEKILKVIGEIHKYFSSKNYTKDAKVNSIFDKQVGDIILFLAINTKYKNPLELKDYDHLIDIMPQLSKCILVNTVYSLSCCEHLGNVIEKLPIKHGIELLEEMTTRLKKSSLKSQLRCVTALLMTVAVKLSSNELSQKDEEDIFSISEVANVMLQLLTGIYPDNLKNLKAVQIYHHMGYTVLFLFDLLLFCNKENVNLKKFIEGVVRTSCDILKNVTVIVFCAWAEIDYDEEPLQSIIAGKAYHVLEKYQKYKDAKELINMLGAFAKKPKTLLERVQAADVATMIKKVNVKDQDQAVWFKALLGSQIFDNKDSVRCIHSWAHLCDKDDVTRLLKLSHQSNSVEAKDLAVKCASTLTLNDLIVVMTRYLYEFKFEGLFHNTRQAEAPQNSIFKKVNVQTTTDSDFVKDMCLLVLQRPCTVLNGVYEACLQNKCYVQCYEPLLASLKEIVNINDFGLDSLQRVALKNVLTGDNVDNYVALLSKLMEIGCMPSGKVVNKFLLPLLEQARIEMNYKRAGFVLQIFLDCSIKIPATLEMTDVKRALLRTIKDCRCTFLDMDILKQQTASYAVDVIMDLCEVRPEYSFEGEPNNSETASGDCDEFVKYYIQYLSGKTDATLFQTLCNGFCIEEHAKCVGQLLTFLPRAVSKEWVSILQDVFLQYLSANAVELVTDVMVLLCKVVQTQDPESNTGRQVMVALKYCLQQYGNALHYIQLNSSEGAEVDIAQGVCKLLKHLPEALKEEEGLSMVNVLTQRSLMLLTNDRHFVCLLISINSPRICDAITNRIAS